MAAVIALATIPIWPRSAPGTIAEQRARLPQAAECQDPVEGVWRAHVFDPLYQDWAEFTLEIRRVEGSATELVGRIVNHTWWGGPEQEQPGPCVSGRLRFVVSMLGRGTFTDGVISFGGTDWQLDEVLCGQWSGGYNLDNFSGTLDPEIQEFQSVNNDGGRAVDEATVFRRIGCLGSEQEDPQVDVTPPPFYPNRRSCGCGGR